MKFYCRFWNLIGRNFKAMLRDAVIAGDLFRGMKQGLMILLPKDGDLELLPNWRPITLLNISYKIFAKVLEIRFQKLLPDVIDQG